METLITPQNSFIERIDIGSTPPGPNSVSLIARMQKVIGRSSYCGLYGVTLDKGKGAYIQDLDGNVFLDCLAAASSCSLGYGQDFLPQTFLEVASKLQQSCFVYSPNVYAIELAEKLLTIAPGNFEKKVMLGLSGSDAAEGAIKAMREYTSNELLFILKTIIMVLPVYLKKRQILQIST